MSYFEIRIELGKTLLTIYPHSYFSLVSINLSLSFLFKKYISQLNIEIIKDNDKYIFLL